jgi:hypothetical protein
MKNYVALACLFCLVLIIGSCKEENTSKKAKSPTHHLNIPASGIESMMEENTSKIIEGTQGSVVLTVGEITRKKADISIKRNDRILDERLLKEKDVMNFDYEGNTYSILLKNIKKPLLGAGSAEISITLE